MSWGICRNSGGGMKHYIYRNGKWSITPTVNKGVIQSDGSILFTQNGTTSQINHLTVSTDANIKMTLALISYNSNNNAYGTIKAGNAGLSTISMGLNNKIEFGCIDQGGVTITLGGNSSWNTGQTVKVYEIWTES